MARLRESSQQDQLDTDFAVILGEAEDAGGGVPAGAALRRFALAVLGQESDLAAARADLVAELGLRRAAQAAAIVAGFDAINRVADATGIPLNPEMVKRSRDLVAGLGLERMLAE